MTNDANAFLAAKEHRGCNIRVASYEARPQTWIPEACVSLSTDLGSKKLWVRSFAHCFANENVTFNNRTEADHWALSAAKVIIDKALREIGTATLPSLELSTKRPSCVLRIARLPIRAFDHFRHFIHRH